MARSDLITTLVKASVQSDKKLIKQTVLSLINEEHSKQHHVFAKRLHDAYHSVQLDFSEDLNSRPTFKDPSNLGELEELLQEIHPERGFKDLYLSEPVLTSCTELIEEQMQADLLRSYSVEPRNRILLIGPPGNGKTSLAKAVAFELGLPLFVLKYESVIGSFLGETSSRLRKIFDFVRSRPCVIFFDEFDTLGKERGDIHETGEIKRVVSALLLQIDSLPTFNVIIAATNHSELIDRAAWRRFQIRLELLPPNTTQLRMMLLRFSKEINYPIDVLFSSVSKSLATLSYSEIEEFLEDIKRRWILKNKNETLDEIIEARLTQLRNRYKTKIDSEKNGKASTFSSGKTSKN